MKSRTIAVAAVGLLAFSLPLFSQRVGGAPGPAPVAKQPAKFDLRDLNGSWLGTQKFFGDNNSVPEPPLTQWAKEHLLMKSISHTGLNLVAKGESSTNSSLTGITDANGVPANVPSGHYPGENCEPLGVPVQFNGTHYYPFQFIILSDRIYQLFEKQLERRTIWLNREHPKDIFPTYFGDSVAKWEGDTLVVDTVGFNGEAGHRWISENVGHYMSDAFHLVERYRLTDATHLTLEMTYYDPKAWGDRAWTGWRKEFKLDSKGDSLQENVCDPSHWHDYDSIILNPITEKK
jgi:hypothetical protein